MMKCCPMCGSQPRQRKKNRTVIQGKTVRNTFIYCERCDVRGPRILYDDYETSELAETEAVKRWNVRFEECGDKMMETLSTNYGKRDSEIKKMFEDKGYITKLKTLRYGAVEIADQKSNFAIYALAEQGEKDIIIHMMEKYNPDISIQKDPEPKAPRKCCARWTHSERDFEIMLALVEEINSLLGKEI